MRYTAINRRSPWVRAHCPALRFARFLLPGLLAVGALSGCGAPDFSSTGGRTNGFDSGFSSGYGSYGSYGGVGGPGAPGAGGSGSAGVRNRATYEPIEFSFELDTQGNPFDYQENDVVAIIQRPDQQTARIPAFFDGGKTWRVRYTPDLPGRYAIARITLNAREVQPAKIEKKEATATGAARPGFIRRDPKDRTRFAFDNGASYYPIGHNAAWTTPKSGSIPSVLASIGQAGLNWSRIWMCHWDDQNLDWPSTGKAEIGTLNLEVARKWDQIVQAAEKNGVYFQMVLQHHGQYSTHVDPNWNENPWNKRNGGFLGTPDEFFTNPRAIALTKAKYRYIVARWGYSPNIMAWELFNEVESTDAVAHGHADEVAAWHDGMAAFLRQVDPYKHLITTSSDMSLAGIWRSMDYYQPHTYPADPVTAVTGIDTAKLDKPLFFGEIGPDDANAAGVASFARRSVWASLMSGESGAAEFWAWDDTQRKDLYDVLRPAAEFVRASGLAGKRSLAPGALSVQTEGRGALVFGPGAGFGKAARTEFTVLQSGIVDGIARFPAYLQGTAHRSLCPEVTFKVDYPQPGAFTVRLGRVSKAGARVTLAVDGEVRATRDFAPSDQDKAIDASLEAQVPAGSHTVRIENTGADWVRIRQFALSPYSPALGVVGRSSRDYCIAWLTNRTTANADPPPAVAGKLTVAGLQAGAYRATWWDTSTGKTVREDTLTVSGRDPLALNTPPIVRDVALSVTRTGQRLAASSTPVVAAKGQARPRPAYR